MCPLGVDRRSCRRSRVKLRKPIVNRYASWLCSFGGFLVSLYFLVSRTPYIYEIGRLSTCTAESSGLRHRSLLPTWGFGTARRITSDCRRSLNSRFRTLFLTSIRYRSTYRFLIACQSQPPVQVGMRGRKAAAKEFVGGISRRKGFGFFAVHFLQV